jgi:alpha/beta superfamily hydrolase
MSFAGRTLIAAPHGHLEAIYQPRDGEVDRIALLMHPHPQFGGTMHNKVVFGSAKALEEAGWETLRFNFRGVEGSTGRYADGVGEVDDARTALAYLREHRPAAKRVLVLGFSFGAGIALDLAAETKGIDALIAIAAPAYALPKPEEVSALPPITFIHGERDELAPLSAVRAWVEGGGARRSRHQLVVITGADHFFADQIPQLRAAVRAAAEKVT